SGPSSHTGRRAAEAARAPGRQGDRPDTYRGAIIASFADVEKALNSIRGLAQQRYWHEEDLKPAQPAFRIAQSRYPEGAEDLLAVLETQRTLYPAQDVSVQLRLARVQARIALYKALGGGWQVRCAGFRHALPQTCALPPSTPTSRPAMHRLSSHARDS
ncbi:hypothetical protein EWW49_30810, partial [Pseudomonas syringae]